MLADPVLFSPEHFFTRSFGDFPMLKVQTMLSQFILLREVMG